MYCLWNVRNIGRQTRGLHVHSRSAVEWCQGARRPSFDRCLRIYGSEVCQLSKRQSAEMPPLCYETANESHSITRTLGRLSTEGHGRRPVAPISFAGNVHSTSDCKVPFLADGGCGALDVRVVFSSPMKGVSQYGEHMHIGLGISIKDTADPLVQRDPGDGMRWCPQWRIFLSNWWLLGWRHIRLSERV